jgi:ComF family protein
MSYLFDLWDDFLSLLFPRLCYGCGNYLLRNEKLICTECYVLIPRTNFHLEDDNPVARIFWGRCKIEKAAAFSFYNRDSRIRSLIHNLKYRGIKDIGIELGRIYGLTLLNSGFTKDIDLIVPVPLHPLKEHIRGFNQSYLISEGVSEVTGLPVVAKIIGRVSKTETQTRKSRYERWKNVEGTFSVEDPKCIRGKHVLLIDDVITTGSTIESCAAELLKTEGVRVSVAALAVSLV